MSGSRTPLRVGTRGSALALAQAEIVVAALAAAHGGLDTALDKVVTGGDRDIDRPLPLIGGKGVFTKELDDALLAGRIDAAVHSLKDVPTDLPPGLVIGAVGHRANPFDVLLTLDGRILDELEPGDTVGTSSLRRRAQLLLYNPDLDVVDMRGNLETRWKKLESGAVAALCLAAAGLERLGWQDRVSEILTQEIMVPAVGQGFLAIVVRADDAKTLKLVAAYEDPLARAAAECERGFLEALGGGCQVPAGALAQAVGGQVVIEGIIASPDGIHVYRGDHQGRKSSAGAVGKRLAIDLLDQGGDKIVAKVRAAQPRT